MKPVTGKCRAVLQHVCENLDENLASKKCREIRQHLDGCADCRMYLESLKQTVLLYKAYPAPKVPRKSHALLMTRLRRK